jgi:alanyl-tRNA synthetase
MSKDPQNRYAVNRLVQDFLEYFAARGHTVVPSAPLLPEDPTLLFTAAGMVPFKAYYSHPESAPYGRAASVQKCLRAGGKQSDLENVGRTLRHHTFFEMLGNFSFGDYFKKEAIEWAWELSIDVWKLDKARIWVTIYDDDDEAHDLWANHIGFPKERIKRLGKKDNFWGPVGDTGVCGPSSELHIDTGREGPEGGPGQDDSDRYIEYWNLVFPQFFYTEKGVYDPLPRPGIDTGMGLERLAFILQGAEDNFHTDEFLPIRRAIASALPKSADAGKAALAINAAADHVRALTFALAEGIMPSNDGRGYVLRRLLRRALTKMQPFGVREPFLARGVDAVVAAMSTRYPDLQSRAALVKDVITAEETRFLDTLEQGMNRLETLFDDARKKKRKTIAGADVFQLYDTFGFPPELTREMAQDRGLDADMAGFEKAMAQQKERARKSAKFQGADDAAAVGQGAGATWNTRTLKAIAKTEFLGYEDLDCSAEIVSLGPARSDRAARVDGAALEFTTDRTVFYPEGGGQVGDAGSAAFGDIPLLVADTYRSGDRIAHLVRVPGELASAIEQIESHPEGRLHVDKERRFNTMRNHTATHLLHAALRQVLGTHVTQAGSLVAPDRLRFDFHHYQAVKPEEVAEIERIVNQAVMSDLAVTAEYRSYDDAIADGAMALFGEKYGDVVRMVTIDAFSRELCGGTHLRRTGEVGAFFVRQESAVASGVRRVEAVTGTGALEMARGALRDWEQVAALLRVSPADVERRVRALLDEHEALVQQRKRDEERRAQSEAADALAGAEDIGGVHFVALRVDVPDVNALRSYGDALRGRLGTGVGLVCQSGAEKPVCLVVASDSAIKERGIRADDLTRKVGAELGYRGGGKPHMAQFGIPGIQEFDRVRDFLRGALTPA